MKKQLFTVIEQSLMKIKKFQIVGFDCYGNTLLSSSKTRKSNEDSKANSFHQVEIMFFKRAYTDNILLH